MALSLFSDIPDTCYTSQLQKIEIVEPTVTIRGSLKPEQRAELEALANALLAK